MAALFRRRHDGSQSRRKHGDVRGRVDLVFLRDRSCQCIMHSNFKLEALGALLLLAAAHTLLRLSLTSPIVIAADCLLPRPYLTQATPGASTLLMLRPAYRVRKLH